MPTYRDLWSAIRDELPKKGRKTEDVERRAEAARRAGRGAAQPLRQLREGYSSAGSRTPRRRREADAARVHRRLQQHQRLQAGLRLHRRLGQSTLGTTTTQVVVPGKLPLFSNVDGRRLAAPAEHDPGRQRAARIGRGDERRLQEDRRRARSRSSRPSTARGSPAATPTT